MTKPQPATTDTIDAAAAQWLARRDRGLSPAEQDEYLQWLQADPRHTEAVTRHAAALERMMQLYEWQPAHDTEPNPDLFLPRRSFWAKAGAPPRRTNWWAWSAGLAAAAALVVIAYFAVGRGPAPGTAVAASPTSHLRVNERLALPDGSRIELKDGSQVMVLYSETERRVRLTGGEAQFTVWKDAIRPFMVDAAGVEVRAVGTVFSVRLEAQAVQVLVTECCVRLDTLVGPSPFVSAGERAMVPLTVVAATPVVTAVTPEETREALAWQAPRLQFFETPLVDAVAEFNRLNRHQLVLGEPALGDLRIGGTFRPDNVEGFVRLLGETLGLRAEADGDNRLVLRRR